MYVECAQTCHDSHEEMRGPVCGTSSLFPPLCVFEDGNQVSNHAQKHIPPFTISQSQKAIL